MQTINNQFFKFLTNIFDKTQIKINTYDQFNQYFNILRNYQYLPIDFDGSLEDYPMYPSGYKYYDSLQITTNKSFSSQKIISTALPNSLYLNKNNLDSNLVSINTKVQKIPVDINNINFTHLTQKIFINNDYLNSYMLTLQQNKVYENDYIFYNLLFTDLEDSIGDLFNINLIQMLSLYYSTYSIYNSLYSIEDSLFLYFYNLDNTEQPLTFDNLSSSFDNFLSTVDNSIYTDLTKFILKNNFNMISPDSSILSSTTSFIVNSQLPNLVTNFNQFLNNNYDNLLKLFFNTVFSKFNNFIFYYVFKKLLLSGYSGIIDQNNLKTDLSYKLSDDHITILLQSLNTYDLQKYLLPIFLYSSSPIKFINIIPQFIKEFITNNFLTITEYDEIFNTAEINNTIFDTINNINSLQLNDFFNNEININEIIIENNLSGLISSIFITELFQDFTDSDEFNDFIINMLDDINSFLYNDKIIQYGQNWYTCIELTKSFFKTFFLTYINYQTSITHTNQIFPSLQTQLEYYFNNTTINYTGNEDQINIILSQQFSNTKMKTDIQNLTKNIFYGHLNETIYNKILTFYINT